MSMRDLPKKGRKYRIWDVVETLCVDRYDELKEESMRGSYYLIRGWLEKKRDAGEITTEEFDYIGEKEQYEYYREDVWVRIERKHGLERPDTKPPTLVIEKGTEHTEAHLWNGEFWDRARGFIFVEKSGRADDLEMLSRHGWLIVSAQGESTRTFREYLVQDGTDRPVLAVTDADFYGGGMVETLKGHSKRTKHLRMWENLESRITHIGLKKDHADRMELPEERDPTQSPDKWRTELDALTVLKTRHDMDNPLLTYVVAEMDRRGIPLCPQPVPDAEEKVRSALRFRLEQSMQDVIEEAVDRTLEDEDIPEQMEEEGEGPLMELRIRDRGGEQVGDEELTRKLEEVANRHHDKQYWRRKSRYEEEVKKRVGPTDIISRMIEAER